MDSEVTVAELVAREGGRWPTVDPDDQPRHLLAEPQPGDLAEYWAGAFAASPPAPRAAPSPVRDVVDDETPARLVRQYVLSRKEKPGAP